MWRRQDSAQLLEGEVPIVSTMVDAAGNPIAWIYHATPVGGSRRSHRRHHEAGDRLDRGQAIRRAQRRRRAGHPDRTGRLPAGRRRHPRRLDDRAAVRQELQPSGERPDRRRAAGGDRDHAGAQAARDPDGAGTRQGAVQAGDPDPVSEPGVVRQRQLTACRKRRGPTSASMRRSSTGSRRRCWPGWCSPPARSIPTPIPTVPWRGGIWCSTP